MFMTIVVLGALVYFFVKSYNRLQALAATVKKMPCQYSGSIGEMF